MVWRKLCSFGQRHDGKPQFEQPVADQVEDAETKSKLRGDKGETTGPL